MDAILGDIADQIRSDQITYWFIKSWQAQLNNT